VEGAEALVKTIEAARSKHTSGGMDNRLAMVVGSWVGDARVCLGEKKMNG